LLALARETIRRYLDNGTTPLARGFPPVAERLQGAFVTLNEHGELRGCIGHMAEDRPLAQVVGAMALAAALEDPRFSPVAAREVPGLEIEISVLTPMQRVAGPEAIVLGRDGVVLRKDGRSAVFLPQVAGEQGWDRPTMLQHLAAKAGLDTDAWQSGAEFLTFQAIVFRESEFR
jgi:AmmeMemoRadiSam system protein A